MKRWPWPLTPRRRNWPSTWLSSRACICPPSERLIEPDLRCYRCGGRVVIGTPFNADDWSRS